MVGRSGVARPRARRIAPSRSAAPPPASMSLDHLGQAPGVTGEGGQDPSLRVPPRRSRPACRPTPRPPAPPARPGRRPSVPPRHRPRGVHHQHGVGTEQGRLAEERSGQRQGEQGQGQELEQQGGGDLESFPRHRRRDELLLAVPQPDAGDLDPAATRPATCRGRPAGSTSARAARPIGASRLIAPSRSPTRSRSAWSTAPGPAVTSTWSSPERRARRRASATNPVVRAR